MNTKKTKKCTVVFLDANHIIGSAMIIFKGYFGTVLYSGDLRFHENVIKNNPYLFTPQGEIKMNIDLLILDNTYCDPIFKFPPQEICIEMIKKII